ncbi:13172_t:CDS:2 [Acaulospora morrowiae]|uniref:13172_t:CDS:1 n=1 Tax=Acaulospora morrowiae TaxID=94023 RepID=A0A9N9H9L0_9GLOM|nr:13172_t:CDS:2 [Acaulospora morrowiae]
MKDYSRFLYTRLQISGLDFWIRPLLIYKRRVAPSGRSQLNARLEVWNMVPGRELLGRTCLVTAPSAIPRGHSLSANSESVKLTTTFS